MSINYGRMRGAMLRWLGWGAACASLSLVCALTFAVTGWEALAAMLAGIFSWSVLCGWLAASDFCEERLSDHDWSWGMRWALRLRAAGTLLGAVGMLAGRWIPSVIGMNFLILPDFWLGLISMRIGQGFTGGTIEAGGGAFWPVYVTTLIQGAWVVASILAMAAMLRTLKRLGFNRSVLPTA